MADGRVAENLILPDHPIFATLAWKSRTHRWSNRGGHSVWLQRLPRSLMDGARHLDLDRLGAASRVRTRAGRFEGAQDRAACDGPWRRRVHQLGVVLVRARIALRTAPPGATAPVSSPRRGDGPQDRLLAITQPSEVTDPAAMRARGTARCAPRCAPPARSAEVRASNRVGGAGRARWNIACLYRGDRHCGGPHGFPCGERRGGATFDRVLYRQVHRSGQLVHWSRNSAFREGGHYAIFL